MKVKIKSIVDELDMQMETNANFKIKILVKL